MAASARCRSWSARPPTSRCSSWPWSRNIFREDLNPIERAWANRQYCDDFKLSADQVAQRLGEDRSTVTNYLRILELPTEVKDWVAEGKLSMATPVPMLGLRTPADVIQAAG